MVAHDPAVCGLDPPSLCEGCINQFRKWQVANGAAGRLLAYHAQLFEEIRRELGRIDNNLETLALAVEALEGVRA